MAFISNGTTILDAGAFDVSLGSKILLSTATASASSSIEFTSGIDSTYDIYKWEFINIHAQTNAIFFQFNLSTDGGSNYNVTKTSTYTSARHNEIDNYAELAYIDVNDLAQSTSDQYLMENIGNENDESGSGSLYLFSPSSNTYVKHFMSETNHYEHNNLTMNVRVGGYGNTSSPIDAIKFSMSSGNIDAGTIKMYGIKGS